MKLNESQERALKVLKTALANHKAKPTKDTAEVVRNAYARALRNTLSADNLNKDEVTVLKSVVEPTPEPETTETP